MNIRLAITILSLVSPAGACACDCSTRDLAARLKSSNLVFVGEVQPSNARIVVVFRVAEQFKGQPSRHVVVTAQNSDCDYFPLPSLAKPGTRYLVFVGSHASKNISSQCSGTSPTERASEDI